MTRPLLTVTPLLVLALTLAGCASHLRINRLLNDPTRYQNRDVTVEGTVTGAVGLVVAGGYRVDDGSGTLTVISSGNPPRKGSRVKVRGRVQSGVNLMGQSFGTTLRERDRQVRY